MNPWYQVGWNNDGWSRSVIASGGGGTIGVPIVIGSAANFAGGANISTASSPAGNLVVVFIAPWNATNGTVSSVVDSVGNTYTLAAQPSASAGVPYPCAMWYCSNALAIPTTASLTVGTGVAQIYIALSVSGANGGLDQSVTGALVSATTYTLTTGTLGSSSEIIFGGIGTLVDFGGTVTIPSFTEVEHIMGGNFSGAAFGYDTVTSTNPVTFSPTWTGGVNTIGVLASFKAG